jgi:glycosyltransferase involved in cell wall biosynthesis
LSRIHRKKGLIELLEAWHKSVAPTAGWKLKIAGPDDGGFHIAVERRIDELQLAHSVSLLGEVTGRPKWELMTESAYFILPSFNENFGIAIAEALACGVPVITTKNTPWQSIETEHAGWWIDHQHDNLVEAINEAVDLPIDIWSRCSTAAASIGRSFRWSDVSKILEKFYSQLQTSHKNT